MKEIYIVLNSIKLNNLVKEKIQTQNFKREDFLGIGYAYHSSQESFILSSPNYLKEPILENVERGFFLPSLDPHLILYDRNLRSSIKLWLILTYKNKKYNHYEDMQNRAFSIANSIQKKVLVLDLDATFFDIFFENKSNYYEHFESIFSNLLQYSHCKTIFVQVSNKAFYQISLNTAYKLKHKNPSKDFIFKLY